MPSRRGSPNRNKQFLLKRLQDMYGDDFHPIMEMARNCVELQKAADTEIDPEKKPDRQRDANAEWARIAEYTEPKLKAVEHSVNEELAHLISDMPLNEEEWESEYGDSVETAAGTTESAD